MMDNLETDSVFGSRFCFQKNHSIIMSAPGKTRVLFIDYEHVIKRCEKCLQVSQPAGK